MAEYAMLFHHIICVQMYYSICNEEIPDSGNFQKGMKA